ncbi:MAG: hypothetical protein V7K60_29495 [Nostoc sp.]
MFGRNVAILTRTTCTFRVTEKKVAIASQSYKASNRTTDNSTSHLGNKRVKV